ncbi:hypothetical protein M0805_009748 [Coniferiporia weirii]|nr:hypothetical protein M0805_009748 [Coniferiporia weirii]
MNHQHQYADDERKNRFTSGGADTPRSASQPPTTNGDGFYSSPAMQIYGSPGGRNAHPSLGSPWAISSGRLPSLSRSASIGTSTSVPRSSSFSASAERAFASGAFASAIRESHSFPSTFEDDESEALSDTTQDYAYPEPRGRAYLSADTRSRSQSLATATRPGPIGSPPTSWMHASGPLSIPGRYGEIKPPGSRYGSLGNLARSPVGVHASPSPTGLRVGHAELSNISPLARDVGQILLDEEAWGGNGGDSGTTSRRHSVSIVQPRRGIVGFNAPEHQDDGGQAYFGGNSGGGGGLAISDDELAVGLNMLNINPPSRSSLPVSQPSSLPIYAPLSRPSNDTVGAIAESLSVPSGEHFPRRMMRSPSESAYSVSSGTGSPPRGTELSPRSDGYGARSRPAEIRTDVSPQMLHAHISAQQQRYIPGHNIQYIPEGVPAVSTSPTYMRSGAAPNQSFMQMQAQMSPLSPTRQQQHLQQLHQQQLAGAAPIQRRASQSEGNALAPSLAELGRGVPLHAVPGTWALYIVEFKAGRTDLFYVADHVGEPIRVGDIVIVEADRGKDLGKVVNDTITAAEVEAFQRQQQQSSPVYGGGDQSYGGGPTSPDGPSSHKREINPKKIYGKANPQDTQLLITKHQDEAKALALCQTKVRQKKLPMEVIDAEYQWDRRKLTFYFIAEKRIDFRELVRELFRLYKTRIWMASLQGPAGSSD